MEKSNKRSVLQSLSKTKVNDAEEGEENKNNSSSISDYKIQERNNREKEPVLEIKRNKEQHHHHHQQEKNPSVKNIQNVQNTQKPSVLSSFIKKKDETQIEKNQTETKQKIQPLETNKVITTTKANQSVQKKVEVEQIFPHFSTSRQATTSNVSQTSPPSEQRIKTTQSALSQLNLNRKNKIMDDNNNQDNSIHSNNNGNRNENQSQKSDSDNHNRNHNKNSHQNNSSNNNNANANTNHDTSNTKNNNSKTPTSGVSSLSILSKHIKENSQSRNLDDVCPLTGIKISLLGDQIEVLPCFHVCEINALKTYVEADNCVCPVKGCETVLAVRYYGCKKSKATDVAPARKKRIVYSDEEEAEADAEDLDMETDEDEQEEEGYESPGLLDFIEDDTKPKKRTNRDDDEDGSDSSEGESEAEYVLSEDELNDNSLDGDSSSSDSSNSEEERRRIKKKKLLKEQKKKEKKEKKEKKKQQYDALAKKKPKEEENDDDDAAVEEIEDMQNIQETQEEEEEVKIVKVVKARHVPALQKKSKNLDEEIEDIETSDME